MGLRSDEGIDSVRLPTPRIRRIAVGVRRLARPKMALASAASVLLGAAAALDAGSLAPGWLLLTVLGIFFVEVARTASGEVLAFDSGADRVLLPEERSPFSGSRRVILDDLLTRGQTIAIAALGYALALATGLVIVFYREPGVLGYALAGVALAWFYHAGPLRLADRGLGELAVAVTYGPLICLGTYLVQRGEIAPVPALLSVPLGLLIGAFVWVNEFPDVRADRLTGKRTLVVRLGRETASQAFAGLLVMAFSLLVALLIAGLPRGAWAGLIAVGPAWLAARNLLAGPLDMPRIVAAQAQTLLAFSLYAVGVAVGLLVF